MTEESKNKYKMFRNYMVNELGITKQDIETWTKESVAVEVVKLVGQFNVEDMVRDAIKSCANTAINGKGFQSGRELRETLALELAKKITISISE